MVTPMEVAQRAELMATAAQTRISSHELECARRYNEVAAQFSLFQDKLDEIKDNSNKRFRAIVGGILTIIGTAGTNLVVHLMRLP